MSNESPSKNNRTLTFLGSLGAILIFLLIVLVAYLPNRAEPVDAEIVRERQVRADEARAAHEPRAARPSRAATARFAGRQILVRLAPLQRVHDLPSGRDEDDVVPRVVQRAEA